MGVPVQGEDTVRSPDGEGEGRVWGTYAVHDTGTVTRHSRHDIDQLPRGVGLQYGELIRPQQEGGGATEDV